MARLTKRLTALALTLLLPAATQAAQCGSAIYDPANYVCHDNQFLCPVVNGEGLSYCNGACYSRFMYQCVNSGTVLAQLPRLDDGARFALRAWNPTSTAVHNKPVAACGRTWTVGGPTCAYCPVEVVGAACPAGNATAMAYPGAMNAMVPGGQAYYLDANWGVGYTQAHSASVPLGATLGGLVAYQGGGFVNLNGPGTNWVACPPTAGGDGTGWRLRSENATTAGDRGNCVGINLAVEIVANQASAWQYT
ncbi:hypothetical protein MAPG_08149 [Magnaporthiopsis poae ATCC 64411]|uniref:Endo-1,3(4)-beta-glucanase 1 carbohydrate binding domain-containing protein n=1 Tax=Magnaporthiopsis poae (strain ATCC 64411 / 73-15) TaxID=644358 RepID=A0A0C4E6K6_MAGP6|nr:hypothetical protein MAPG_08149 [Magnaporthiopsis poae ATCC 64411]